MLLKRLTDLTAEAVAAGPVERIINKLDAETATVLRNLLNDERVSTRLIHSALKDEGHKIGRDTVADYRRKLKVRSDQTEKSLDS